MYKHSFHRLLLTAAHQCKHNVLKHHPDSCFAHANRLRRFLSNVDPDDNNPYAPTLADVKYLAETSNNALNSSTAPSELKSTHGDYSRRLGSTKSSFQDTLLALREYNRIYGHCPVQALYVVPNDDDLWPPAWHGYPLGRTLSIFRRKANQGILPNHQYNELTDAGMVWDKVEYNWRYVWIPMFRKWKQLYGLQLPKSNEKIPCTPEWDKSEHGMKIGVVFQRVYLDYRVPDWASQEIRDMGFWRKRANPRERNDAMWVGFFNVPFSVVVTRIVDMLDIVSTLRSTGHRIARQHHRADKSRSARNS